MQGYKSHKNHSKTTVQGLEQEFMDFYLTQSDQAQLEQQEPFPMKLLPQPIITKQFPMKMPYVPFDPSTLIPKGADSFLDNLDRQIQLMEKVYEQERQQRMKQSEKRREEEHMKNEEPVCKKMKKNEGGYVELPQFKKSKQMANPQTMAQIAAMRREKLSKKAEEDFKRFKEDEKRKQEQKRRYQQRQEESERNHLGSRPNPQIHTGYDTFQVNTVERKHFPMGSFTINKKEIQSIQNNVKQMERKELEKQMRKKQQAKEFIDLD